MNQQRTPDDKEIVSARVRYAQREELAQGLAHLESQVGRVLWLHRLRKARFCYIFHPHSLFAYLADLCARDHVFG